MQRFCKWILKEEKKLDTINHNTKNNNENNSVGININSHLKLLESSYKKVKEDIIIFKKLINQLQIEIDQLDVILTAKNKAVKEGILPNKNKIKSDLEKQIKNQMELRNLYEAELADIKFQMSDIQSLIIQYKNKVEYLEELGGLYTN